MGFAEELWRIAPPFLKQLAIREKSDLWLWLQATEIIYKEARTKVFLLRRQALVPTATGLALDVHGRDRKMPRNEEEDDSSYSIRLLNYRDYYMSAGTKRGILGSLDALGYFSTDFYPLYKEKYKEYPNPDYVGLWSQFTVIILAMDAKNDKPVMDKDLLAIRKAVEDTRAPESKCYAITLNLQGSRKVSSLPKLNMTADIKISNSRPSGLIQMDGIHKMDGTWQLNSKRILSTMKSTVRFDSISRLRQSVLTITENFNGNRKATLLSKLNMTAEIKLSNSRPSGLIQMDGIHKMDGTWQLNSKRTVLTITKSNGG